MKSACLWKELEPGGTGGRISEYLSPNGHSFLLLEQATALAHIRLQLVSPSEGHPAESCSCFCENKQ